MEKNVSIVVKEYMMDNQPTKELIRTWLLRRQALREPLPEPEQIRRNVGWAPQDARLDENAPRRNEGAGQQASYTATCIAAAVTLAQ